LVRLALTNSGDEIASAAQAALFDRFVRLSPGRSRGEEDGVGLGLPITKAIMRAHKGDVKVRSGAGVNTFSLEFSIR
jgi:two-component system, OmpR family, heavy metal sensor histidine kinase CusS